MLEFSPWHYAINSGLLFFTGWMCSRAWANWRSYLALKRKLEEADDRLEKALADSRKQMEKRAQLAKEAADHLQVLLKRNVLSDKPKNHLN